MEHGKHYIHRPLPEGWIRILHLDQVCLIDTPGRPARDAAIKCHLETISSSTFEPGWTNYIALSYVWGASTKRFRRFLICDGRYIAIGVNLYNALSQLLSDAVGPLWVDAICIDQSNEQEKLSQIGMMGAIYRSAKLVIAWLGIGGDPPTEAVGAYWSSLRGDKPMSAEVLEAGSEYFESCGYFNRVWTFQELVLATHISVQCGPYRIDWDSLVTLGVPHRLINIVRVREQVLNSYPGRVRQKGQYIQETARLTELLVASSERQCTIASDRIYSLLGLYQKNDLLAPSLTLTTTDVYARAAFVTAKELNFLACFDLAAPQIRRLGSWELWHQQDADFQALIHGVVGFCINESLRPRSWIPDLRKVSSNSFARVLSREKEEQREGEGAKQAEHRVKRPVSDQLRSPPPMGGPLWCPIGRSECSYGDGLKGVRLHNTVLLVSGAVLGEWVEPPEEMYAHFTVTTEKSWDFGSGTFRRLPSCVGRDRICDLVPDSPGQPWRWSKEGPDPGGSLSSFDSSRTHRSLVRFDHLVLHQYLLDDGKEHRDGRCWCRRMQLVSNAEVKRSTRWRRRLRIPSHRAQRSMMPDSNLWNVGKGSRRFWLCAVYGYDSLVVIRPREEEVPHGIACELIGRLGDSDRMSGDEWSKDLWRAIDAVRGFAYPGHSTTEWRLPANKATVDYQAKARASLLNLNFISSDFTFKSFGTISDLQDPPDSNPDSGDR